MRWARRSCEQLGEVPGDEELGDRHEAVKERTDAQHDQDRARDLARRWSSDAAAAPTVAAMSSAQRNPSQSSRSRVIDERDRARDQQRQHDEAEQHEPAGEAPAARSCGPSVVVGLARDDLVRAVELLEQDDARELVGQRHRAEREPAVGALELQPERAADDEAPVQAGSPALLQDAGEVPRSRTACPRCSAASRASASGSGAPPARPRGTRRARASRDPRSASGSAGRHPRTAAAAGRRPPRSASRSAILGTMSDEEGAERHINIHFSPEDMAGHYANFANVSHSDYEFTITFARVDHEVEEEEIPGVVVSRINLSRAVHEGAHRRHDRQLLQVADPGGHQEPPGDRSVAARASPVA